VLGAINYCSIYVYYTLYKIVSSMVSLIDCSTFLMWGTNILWTEPQGYDKDRKQNIYNERFTYLSHNFIL